MTLSTTWYAKFHLERFETSYPGVDPNWVQYIKSRMGDSFGCSTSVFVDKNLTKQFLWIYYICIIAKKLVEVRTSTYGRSQLLRWPDYHSFMQIVNLLQMIVQMHCIIWMHEMYNFESQTPPKGGIMQCHLKDIGINQYFTTDYCPWAIGTAERVRKDLLGDGKARCVNDYYL